MGEDGTMVTPDFATHNHLAGRRPFLNLSELDGEEMLVVLAEREELGRQGQHLTAAGGRP